MAKATKKTGKKAITLTRASLVATATAASLPADINVQFTSGLGQVTALLIRRGVIINTESISASGVIHFVNVLSGDAIVVNGVCAGRATITVSVPTNPATPESFTKKINAIYSI